MRLQQLASAGVGSSANRYPWATHPSGTSNRAIALPRSRGRFGVLGRGHRAQRPIACAAPPIQACPHRRQYLDHVVHQIIGGLAVVDDHDPAAPGRQRGPQMLRPEPRQPIPMLHNNHRGRRVRQHPGQLRPPTIQARTDLGNHLTHRQPAIGGPPSQPTYLPDRTPDAGRLLGHPAEGAAPRCSQRPLADDAPVERVWAPAYSTTRCGPVGSATSTRIVPDGNRQNGTGIRSSRTHAYAVCGCRPTDRIDTASLHHSQSNIH